MQCLYNVSEWYSSRKGLDSKLIQYRAKTLLPYFKGTVILELGCADSVITEILVKYFKRIVAVDGSSKFCNTVRNRIKMDNLKVICPLFEKLELNEKFDTIIMAHILEHVENPNLIINRAKTWLKDSGVILIDVPNANSIHR